MARLADTTVAQLQQYSACDVSDALLKLKVAGGGFVADLHLYSDAPSLSSVGRPSPSSVDSSLSSVDSSHSSVNPSPSSVNPSQSTAAAPSIVAPISTVLFVAKDEPRPSDPATNIAAGAHWADMTEPGTFVVIQQPAGQTNAVCGGIMALRIKQRGARGIVVAGRVRDLAELRSTRLPIWAQGTSTVGAGAASLPWATQVPLRLADTAIHPGDVAVHDAANGFVVIPAHLVDAVVDRLPKLVAADDKVKRDVAAGMSVAEAFKLHR